MPVPLSKENVLAFDQGSTQALTSANQAQPPGDEISAIMSRVAWAGVASWWLWSGLGVPLAGQRGPVRRKAEWLSDSALQEV